MSVNGSWMVYGMEIDLVSGTIEDNRRDRKSVV